jgi:hypothetical protein
MGTERIPVTGRQRDKGGADYQTEMFAFGDKDGYKRPMYLETWMAELEAYARPRNQIPVVVWHRPGARRADDLVFLRWKDWIDLHGTSQRL